MLFQDFDLDDIHPSLVSKIKTKVSLPYANTMTWWRSMTLVYLRHGTRGFFRLLGGGNLPAMACELTVLADWCDIKVTLCEMGGPWGALSTYTLWSSRVWACRPAHASATNCVPSMILWEASTNTQPSTQPCNYSIGPASSGTATDQPTWKHQPPQL